MPPLELTLDPEQCRARQARLQSTMERMQVDRVLLLAPENVQWLTGFRPHRLMSSGVPKQTLISPPPTAEDQDLLMRHLAAPFFFVLLRDRSLVPH